jgi:hypothetical protein
MTNDHDTIIGPDRAAEVLVSVIGKWSAVKITSLFICGTALMRQL